MWRGTMGILLVADILDDHRSFTDLFSNGNPLIWGCLGWCALLLWIIWLGYQIIQYVKKHLGLKHARTTYASKQERNRVRLDREKLNKEKIKEEYEKRRRELEKELKRELDELKLKEEWKKNSIKDFKYFFIKRKEVEQHIEGLTKNIKDLEKKINKLEKHMRAEIEECLSICDELQKKVEKCVEQIKDVECELEKNKNIFKKKMKKIPATCVMVFLILMTDGNNMLVTAKELKNTLSESFDSSKEIQVNEPVIEESESEDVTLGNKEKNIGSLPDIENDLREHMDYNFILEDEQLHKVMDDDIVDIIFLKEDYPKDVIGYEQFLADCREGNLIEILPEINYDSELNLDELLNEIAEDMEKPFLEKINMGKIIRTQIEWEQSAPKSMELENIINKRRQVLGMDESVPIRRTIYYRLANDYQRLGKECLIQGKDSTQIYYYYVMSIYCCYCALGYERFGENSYSDEVILNYVKARYKDIIDNVKMEIPIEKRNSAEKIYFLLNR